MKKRTTILLIALLIAGCWLASCSNTGQPSRNLQFEEITLTKSEHLFADESKPSCNLSIDFAFVNKATTIGAKDSINADLLSALFGKKYQQLSPQEAIEGYAKEYVTNYRADLEPMIQKDIDNHIDKDQLTAWYSYEQELKGSVETYMGILLTYRTYKNEYSGGPHGMYTTEFTNLNLSTIQPILLDELFVEDYQETLTELLWYQLALDNGVETHDELEEMGYATTGELAPTENFYISEDGITFYYNVYEIAPYSMGPTQITLSYDMLEYILNYDNKLVNELITLWN
ncbi:MAG: DUF3298 domain-containing protein [Bacteroides sp.]|nr:DUF3298 domain-containing protein [Bacteroides sp.]